MFYPISRISAVLSDGCQKEKKTERDYPQIRTLAVDQITAEGARFNAAIISGDVETITEHGFVWGRYDFLTIGNSEKISIEDSPATDQFSCDISFALEEMKEYFVRSYVKAGDMVVYGDPVKFTSLGSMAPEIIDFEPRIASWGDTITISGKNFSYLGSSNSVHFGNIIGNVLSSTHESIKVKVPNVTSQFSQLSVEVIGNRAIADNLFELITPGRITGTNKTDVTWGDTLVLEGVFPFSDHQLGIYVDDKVATVLNMTDSRATVVIPNSIIYHDSILIGLSIDYFKIDYIHKLHLKKPALFSILPATFGWGDTIELIGIFNPLLVNNFVYFSTIQAKILESSNSKIKCAVPDINGHNATLSFKISNYTFNYDPGISLSGPIIKSIEPSKISTNNSIIVRGKYFKEGNTKLKINSILCESSVYQGQISARVPNTANGMATVEVDVYDKKAINTNFLEISNPEITDFSPKQGIIGDIITITGVGFDPVNTTVNMGYATPSILEISSTEIKIQVPNNVVDYSYISVNTVGAIITSNSAFHLLPPKIITVDPLISKPGEVITITGENFNPGYNNINIGNYHANIVTESTTTIKFILPDQPMGEYTIYLGTYAHQTSFTEKMSYKTPWITVRSLPRTPNSGMGVILADELFVFGGYNSQRSYITYLIMGGSASEGIDCPEWDQIDGVGYSVSNLGYIGLGRLQVDGVYTNNFYRFNPMNRTWASANSFSGTARSRSFYFSIGDKCYLGGGSNQETTFSDFWVFDVQTNSWSLLGTFPGGITNIAYALTINGKAYVIDGTELWEYTPENNSWLKKADFPGSSRSKGCGFVINGRAYFGTGYNATGVLNDFWQYDPSLNQWQRLTNYPFKTFGSYGGSYNGYGYMGGGFGDDYRYWEESQLLRYVPENE